LKAFDLDQLRNSSLSAWLAQANTAAEHQDVIASTNIEKEVIPERMPARLNEKERCKEENSQTKFCPTRRGTPNRNTNGTSKFL